MKWPQWNLLSFGKSCSGNVTASNFAWNLKVIDQGMPQSADGRMIVSQNRKIDQVGLMLVVGISIFLDQ